jgi:hypothetical protein
MIDGRLGQVTIDNNYKHYKIHAKQLQLLVIIVYQRWFLTYCLTQVLTPKGPMSVNGFLGSSGRLSQRQKHEWSSEILEEGGPM